MTPPALVWVSVGTGEKRAMTSPPPGSYADCAPALSPDGLTLAFVRHQAAGVSNVLLQRVSRDLLPLGEPRSLTETPAYYWELAWAAGGKHLLASTRDHGLWQIPLSGSDGPQPIAGTDGLVAFSVSGAANRLVFSQLRRTGIFGAWSSRRQRRQSGSLIPLVRSTSHRSRPMGARSLFSPTAPALTRSGFQTVMAPI